MWPCGYKFMNDLLRVHKWMSGMHVGPIESPGWVTYLRQQIPSEDAT